MRRVAVIGGGITGLAAAWELSLAGGIDAVVFESSDRLGGKILSTDVPGLDHPLDAAADAFLARVPDALDVCEALGIDDLVEPTARNAHVFARGALHPLPPEQLLGLPTDLDALAATGLVSEPGIERARRDLTSDAPPFDGDISIGALIRDRLGDEVLEHLVQPLVGGINAGEADGLSAAAVAPQHLQCARLGGSLVRNAAAMKAKVASDAPVFFTPRGGISTLVDRLAGAGGAEIRLATPVGELVVHQPSGGPASVLIDGETFDAAIVATPGHAASAQLAGAAPEASRLLGSLEFSSVVLVTLVYGRGQVDHELDGSGFVVARDAGLSITACSWGSSKWPHWGRADQVILRVSIGHDGSPVDWCARPDAEIVGAVRRDLVTTMGLSSLPTGIRISRWPRCLAQYRPGHLDLVADVHAAVAEAGPLAVAGASLEGVGIPACIRQGRAAARRVLG